MNLSNTNVGDTNLHGAAKTCSAAEAVYDDCLGLRTPGGYLLFCKKSDDVLVKEDNQYGLSF